MQETATAIIVAAGISRRMQGFDKLWIPLAGRTSLARTIDVFEASPLIDSIILVIHADQQARAVTLCKQEAWRKIIAIIPGGRYRRDSVQAGLEKLAQIQSDTRWVMIHDGARPLVTESILQAGMEAVLKHQAAIATVPVKETVKYVNNGEIEATLDRSYLWMVQTPQVFSFPLICQAYQNCTAPGDISDDACILEQQGYPVAIFPGSYANIKITTQDDLLLAEALIQGYNP